LIKKNITDTFDGSKYKKSLDDEVYKIEAPYLMLKKNEKGDQNNEDL
jgi:hypothetical protein